MLARLIVTLDEAERMALSVLCEQDRRPAKWQLKHLVMQEAQRRGLLDQTKDSGAGVRQDIPRAAVPA